MGHHLWRKPRSKPNQTPPATHTHNTLFQHRPGHRVRHTPLRPRPLPLTEPAQPLQELAPAHCAVDSAGTNAFCGGLWSTGGGDMTWSLKDGGTTPSSRTGPADAPVSGGKYLYVEASGNGNPRKTAYLTSAVGTYMGIGFQYHMYGSNIGSLAVETQDTDGGWQQVWGRGALLLGRDSHIGTWRPQHVLNMRWGGVGWGMAGPRQARHTDEAKHPRTPLG